MVNIHVTNYKKRAEMKGEEPGDHIKDNYIFIGFTVFGKDAIMSSGNWLTEKQARELLKDLELALM